MTLSSLCTHADMQHAELLSQLTTHYHQLLHVFFSARVVICLFVCLFVRSFVRSFVRKFVLFLFLFFCFFWGGDVLFCLFLRLF